MDNDPLPNLDTDVPAAPGSDSPDTPALGAAGPGAARSTSASLPGSAAVPLVEQVGSVLLGDPTPIRLAVAAFGAGGHVLLEDTPGVGKTLLSKALARSLGGSFGRVQGTADLLPSDLTGVSIYDDQSREWAFRPGPLFNNVVLVDELNRATPRTQSALLEAMAERQVTVDGVTHPLPDPFFVVATQNPQGDLGTFPLVAGQRDRFSVSLSLGQPGRQAELYLLSGQGGETALRDLAPIASLDEWRSLRSGVEASYVHEAVATYTLDLVDTLRSRLGRTMTLSTRSAIMLLRVAKAYGAVLGRNYVTPDDVQAVVVPALAHRIVDATNGDLPTARSWVADVVSAVRVPPAPGDA